MSLMDMLFGRKPKTAAVARDRLQIIIAQERAQEGRDLRNEGRVEDGKAPKTTEPGTGAKE